MRVAAAQIRPRRGNINDNIDIHLGAITKAGDLKANLIAFPELSLSGYEPTLAESLAMEINDDRLDVFQQRADLLNIVIVLGLPLRSGAAIQIGLLVFQPFQSRQSYVKQYLHVDELPYFSAGHRQLIIEVGKTKIAPAICYESMLHKHALQAKEEKADIYLALVAKDQAGIDRGEDHYPKIAREMALPVVMVNCVGPGEGFTGAGQSACWNDAGHLEGMLDNTEENILLFDSI